MPSWVWGVIVLWAGAVVLFVLGHAGWGVACLVAPAPWYVYELLPSGSEVFAKGYRSFATARREVWLTIDDGPDPATTPQVLELLAKHGITATFFLIGRRARAHPDLVSAIVRAGHGLANHTDRHAAASFWSASPVGLDRELAAARAALGSTGVTGYFRPPAGIKNPWLGRALGRHGLTLVLWSARGLDGLNQPAAESFRRIKSMIRPGAILLAHEVPSAPERTLAYLGQLAAHLGAEGYACVLPPAEALRLSASYGSRYTAL